MKILVVDDDKHLRNVIKEYAEYEKFEVVEATNGIESIEAVKKNDFDIIVLDIMMPKIDGYQALKEIKSIKDIPVIILSARDDEYDKLYGFDLGIDDYLTKPFSPKELIARIKVIVSRTKEAKVENKMFFESLSLDLSSRKVTIDEKQVELTLREYDILAYLLKNKGTVLSRKQLLDDIWGYETFSYDRTIDTHIKSIRKKIGKYSKNIKTVRGIGYKFE